MLERSLLCLCFGAHPIADRSALHKDNRMLPVLPCWRCSQSVNMLRMNLLQNPLKADSRNVMTFISVCQVRAKKILRFFQKKNSGQNCLLGVFF